MSITPARPTPRIVEFTFGHLKISTRNSHLDTTLDTCTRESFTPDEVFYVFIISFKRVHGKPPHQAECCRYRDVMYQPMKKRI